MAITITKLANQCKVSLGASEKKYYDVTAIVNSFKINPSTLVVNSLLFGGWVNNIPLSTITIVATTTHSGMTSVSDFSTALQDLSKIVTQ